MTLKSRKRQRLMVFCRKLSVRLKTDQRVAEDFRVFTETLGREGERPKVHKHLGPLCSTFTFPSIIRDHLSMKYFFCALLFVASTTGSAAPDDLAKHQVPPAMYEFMGQMFRLQPFMFSQRDFLLPKNEKTIRDGLNQLSAISERLPHSKRLDSTTFQISMQTMQRHLADLDSTFMSGRKEYARRMLLATLDGCSSCHTQVPGEKSKGWSFKTTELSGTSYDKGEFLFAVRHYKEALGFYDQFIRSFDKESDDYMPLETAIKRSLVIYVRILRDLNGASKAVSDYLKIKSIPSYLRSEMQGWIRGLDKLKKSKSPDPQSSDLNSIETYAQKIIQPLLKKSGIRFNPEAFVELMQASGIIYDFMNHTKQSSAELLYYLALSDSTISKGYFFSMADRYLKECIVKFPTDAFAQRCYSELESRTIEDYTGSSGLDFPSDVKQELERLRKMIKTSEPSTKR